MDIPVFYANSGKVICTPFDVQVVFADLVEPTPGGESFPCVERPVARVVMSPEFAHLVADTILERLAEFSLEYGTLRNPTLRQQVKKPTGEAA